jgi:hypothetical protein
MYYLGPTFGLDLSGKYTAETLGIVDEDLEDVKTLDVGLALGAGAGFELGGKKVLAELRWTTGFTDVYDLEGNLESINQVFSLTAGVAF